MRAGFFSSLHKVGWIFPLIVLLMGYTTGVANAATRSMPDGTSAQKVVEVPGLSSFAGTWYAHGSALIVKSDGQAHFEARVYTWCAPGVAKPCDSMQGNNIINGFKENIQFERVSSSIAYGKITSGDEQAVGSVATLTRLPGDQLLFSTGKGIGNILCGPNAAVGACGA